MLGNGKVYSSLMIEQPLIIAADRKAGKAETLPARFLTFRVLLYCHADDRSRAAKWAARHAHNHATFGWIRMLRGLADFGRVSSRMPFLSVAVVLSTSTSAGRSTTRRIWSEHCSA